MQNLSEIIADILAYQAPQFDEAPVFFAVPGLNSEGDADIRHHRGPFDTADEAKAECDAIVARGLFDYANIQEQERGDLDVSGADLMDRFTQWRIQLKAAAPFGDPSKAAIEMIRTLSGLVDDALVNHIYNDQDGEEADDSCAYTRASEEAETFLATYSDGPFAPAPIGLLEITDDLSGAVGELQHQLDQVCQLYSYTDDSIVAAHDEGDEAVKRLDLYKKAVAAGPAEIFIFVDGGNVQELTCERALPGLAITVIDYDVQDEDEAVYSVKDSAGMWRNARADPFTISTEANPTVRTDEPEE